MLPTTFYNKILVKTFFVVPDWSWSHYKTQLMNGLNKYIETPQHYEPIQKYGKMDSNMMYFTSRTK